MLFLGAFVPMRTPGQLPQHEPDGKQNRNYHWHLSAIPGPPDGPRGLRGKPPGLAVVSPTVPPRRDPSPQVGKLANLGPDAATWANGGRNAGVSPGHPGLEPNRSPPWPRPWVALGFLAGELLPTGHNHIAIGRIDFHEEGSPARFLGSNQRRATAAEQVQDVFPNPR